MSSTHHEHFVQAFLERRPDDGLVRVDFAWNSSGQPNDSPNKTYTIGVGRHASIELDSYIPAIARSATLHEGSNKKNKHLLGTYIGEQLVEQMEQGTDEIAMIDTSLSFDNRHALAHLQLGDPSTPPALRRACRAMIEAQISLDKAM